MVTSVPLYSITAQIWTRKQSRYRRVRHCQDPSIMLPFITTPTALPLSHSTPSFTLGNHPSVLYFYTIFGLYFYTLFPECYKIRILSMWSLGNGLFSLHFILWKVIQVPACITSSFLPRPSSIPWCGCTTVGLFVQPLKDTGVVSSSGLLWIKLL